MSEERKGKGKNTVSENPPTAVADGDTASAGSSARRAIQAGSGESEPLVTVIRLQDLQSTVDQLVQKVLIRNAAGPSWRSVETPAVVLATPLSATGRVQGVAESTAGIWQGV